MSKIQNLILAAVIATSGGCAQMSIPYKMPINATPPTGQVVVNEAVNILDASGSQQETFADGKATFESIVGAMPDGKYKANNIHFGGYKRVESGFASFNRSALKTSAKNSTFLQGVTPIFDVFENDVAASIGGGSGKAAVVMVSDGITTDYAGRPGSEDRTVAAARALAASRSGDTCFHMVQSGDDAGGASLLKSIANVTKCGSFRNASSLGSARALQQFSRNVYLGDTPPPAPVRRLPVAVVPQADTDGDGVLDTMDACAGTLRMARVDKRGCWTLSDLRFAVNGAGIETGYASSLKHDLEVLRANPGVRIRIDGHTDSDGSAAYNEALSGRRAVSVRDYFVDKGGLDGARFETKGFGESRPIVANDSAANKRRNRRVEITIIE